MVLTRPDFNRFAMHLQSHLLRFLVTAAAALALAASLSAAERATTRYDRAIAQYNALPKSERAAWLSRMFTSRLEPACRLSMTRDEYDSVEAQQLTVLDRVRAGDELSNKGLRTILEQVDRQEQAAINVLTKTYSQVTNKAVGADLWKYQQRMKLLRRIQELEQASAHPFENQPKLIAWMDAAVTQQLMTDRWPLPATPDFNHIDQRPLMVAQTATTEVRTALQENPPQPTASELATQITKYNDELNKLVGNLYGAKRYNVPELNTVVDDLARLGLTRIRLSASVLRIAQAEREQLPQIETLDDAIALARVKVSATRREYLKLADRSEDRGPWDALKGLASVSRRLDTLYTGPDR
jgi:hypothetical protein